MRFDLKYLECLWLTLATTISLMVARIYEIIVTVLGNQGNSSEDLPLCRVGAEDSFDYGGKLPDR